MSIIKNLVARLSLDSKRFSRGLDNAQKRMQNFSKRGAALGKNMTKYVTGPIVAAGGAALAFARRLGQTADEILDLSSATGMSTQAIQEWRVVADRAGVSTNAMTKASQMLTKSMAQGAEGSADMRIGLEQLGLSMEEVRAMSPDDRMRVLMERLQGVDDAAMRAELGTRLLRNGYQELAPILDMTNDQVDDIIKGGHESGKIMSQEALEGADKFRESLDRLQMQLQGVLYGIMGDIMPAINNKLVPAIENKVVPAIQNFIEGLRGVFEWFKQLSPEWQRAIGILIGVAAAAGPVIFIFSKAIGIISALIGVTKALIIATKFLNAVLLANPYYLIAVAIALLIAGTVALVKNWDSVAAFFKRIWDDIKRVFLQTIDFIVQLFLNFTPHGLIIKHWDKIVGYFKGLFKRVIDTFKKAWASIKKVFTGGAGDAVKGIGDMGRDMVARIRDFFSDFRNNGKELIQSLIDGIKDKAKDLANALVDGVKDGWRQATAVFKKQEKLDPGDLVKEPKSGSGDFMRTLLGGFPQVEMPVVPKVDEPAVDKAVEELEEDKEIRLALVPDTDRIQEHFQNLDDISEELDMDIMADIDLGDLDNELQGMIDSLVEAAEATDIWHGRQEHLNEALEIAEKTYGENSEQVRELQEAIQALNETKEMQLQNAEMIGDAIGYNIGMLADEEQGVRDLANATLDSVKQVVGAYLAQALAGVIRQAFSNYDPLLASGIAAAGSGIVLGLFNAIPSFATGGMTTGPTLAMVGDNPGGREYMIPSQIMDKMEGGGAQDLHMEGLVRGKDLKIIMERATAQGKRR